MNILTEKNGSTTIKKMEIKGDKLIWRKEGTNMTDNDKVTLISMEYLLNMTNVDDWHLFHDTIRNKVLSGEVSKNFEKKYKKLVDKMADERE